MEWALILKFIAIKTDYGLNFNLNKKRLPLEIVDVITVGIVFETGFMSFCIKQ